MSLYTAVDLALANSTAVRIADAERRKAIASLAETRDIYIPSFNLGSSLGYSYGFPVGEPSVYNISSQSLVFNFSQFDYLRAARSAVKAADLALANTRQQTILDTSLVYIELSNCRAELEALNQQMEFANRLVRIVQDRNEAGIDSRAALSTSRLDSARLHLRQIQLNNHTLELQDQLGRLTGTPTTGAVTDSASVPALPDLSLVASSEQNTLDATNSPGVQAAYLNARARQYINFGDNRQNLRPNIAFGGQYNRFATFNNYQDYYRHFQHNNFGIGIEIRVPLFDASRKAKAQQSAAEAVRAKTTADQARDLFAQQTMQLQHGVEELAAKQQVAELENQVARDQLQAVLTQLQSGGVASTPLTPKDEQLARIEERRRYIEYLDSSFALTRTKLSLMRATGTIEDWIKSSAKH